MPITEKMHYWQYSDTLNEKRGTTKFKAKYPDTFWNTDIRPNSDIVSIYRLNNKRKHQTQSMMNGQNTTNKNNNTTIATIAHDGAFVAIVV